MQALHNITNFKAGIGSSPHCGFPPTPPLATTVVYLCRHFLGRHRVGTGIRNREQGTGTGKDRDEGIKKYKRAKRFELSTSSLARKRSSQLSYARTLRGDIKQQKWDRFKAVPLGDARNLVDLPHWPY
jgi:hypothetical protein